jgi:hypothetical protein
MDKNSKSVTSLFIVLALLALAALALSVGSKQGSGSQKKLAPGLSEQIAEVSAVKIVAAGAALVADIRSDNDTWVVKNASNYPVDLAKLRDFLESLAQASIVETTTALPENYARIGVSDISSADAGGIQVDIEGAGGVSVILGNTGSGNTTFVRRAGDPQSWRVSGTLQAGRSISDWVDRSVIDIPAADILSVSIRHADDEVVTIDRSGTGYMLANQPADQPLQSPSLLNSIAGVLDNVELDDVQSTATLTSQPVEALASISALTIGGLKINIEAVAQADKVWLTFATEFAADMVTKPEPAADAPAETEPTAKAQAEELNLRLNGWAYRIPTYKSDWLLKRNADLLQSES